MMEALALFRQFGWQEILFIMVILLLLFGAKKLPEMGRGLGKGIKEFKEGVKGLSDEVEKGMKDDAPEDASSSSDASTSAKPDRDSSPGG